jgi:hypothetical protein
LWIRIGSGFSDFVDPDPYWESGSRGKKIKTFQWKKALLVIFKQNFTTKKVLLLVEKILMNNTSILDLI